MSTMVEILQRIVETRGAGCEWGLCRELKYADDYDKGLIRQLFETWEHFSGSFTFPVPDPLAPTGSPGAAAAFGTFEQGEGFIGEYGELRLDLARHLLKELRK